MGYVELHFHLLPGIDDGPRSIEESIELARAAVADGSRTVVATPHVHPAHVLDPAEIPDRVAELSSQLRSRRIPLEVLPGGELSHLMVPTLSGSELELIAHGPLGRRLAAARGAVRGSGRRFHRSGGGTAVAWVRSRDRAS